MESTGILPSASTKRKTNPSHCWTLGLTSKDSSRTIRVILLGQSGVGKTAIFVKYATKPALAVRFATKRFIGEYDRTTERIYKVDGPSGYSWEIADPPGSPSIITETKLRWMDVIVLVYSVTDRVSFEEVSHLRFLVSHARKGRKVPPLVILVGNKADLTCAPGERMVSTAEGQKRAVEIEAHAFHEISTRESVDQVTAVFADTFSLLTELHVGSASPGNPFRLRASTDGSLNTVRRPSPPPRRRFSISTRGMLL